MKVLQNSTEAMAKPSIVELSSNLAAASFECMKMLPAKYILDQAMADGRLRRGGTVIETSSGTFARGLATYAKTLGVKCIIVTGETMDFWLRRVIEDLGAQLVVVEDPGPASGGIQAARLDTMRQLRTAHPGAFWPAQYHNPDNFLAYAPLAGDLIESIGQLDFLVGPCGTGGSSAGTSQFLRKLNPRLKLIGVDLPGSVLFGQRVEDRVIGGMSSSMMTAIPHEAYDVVSWVPEPVAIYNMRELLATHGLYKGGSSGAAFAVARWWSKQHPGDKGAVIFPDSGHRYADTLYNPEWLETKSLLIEEAPAAPMEVNHPHINQGQWTYLPWARQSLADAKTH